VSEVLELPAVSPVPDEPLGSTVLEVSAPVLDPEVPWVGSTVVVGAVVGSSVVVGLEVATEPVLLSPTPEVSNEHPKSTITPTGATIATAALRPSRRGCTLAG
jgi:hypothetical protein